MSGLKKYMALTPRHGQTGLPKRTSIPHDVWESRWSKTTSVSIMSDKNAEKRIERNEKERRGSERKIERPKKSENDGIGCAG